MREVGFLDGPCVIVAEAVEARDLMARGKPALTIWERNFLIGIMAFKTLKPNPTSTSGKMGSGTDAHHHRP